MSATVKIENSYADGWHSETVVRVLPPPADLDEQDGDLDEWWNDVVFPHTGDGHGQHGLSACHTATVLTADDTELIGKSYEWIG